MDNANNVNLEKNKTEEAKQISSNLILEEVSLEKQINDEMSNLQRGFNIVLEDSNIDYIASRRVEITRFWIPKLLKFSLYLNLMTLVCIFLSIIFLLNKPEPKYFGTTPNGKVMPLNTVKLEKNENGMMVRKK